LASVFNPFSGSKKCIFLLLILLVKLFLFSMRTPSSVISSYIDKAITGIGHGDRIKAHLVALGEAALEADEEHRLAPAVAMVESTVRIESTEEPTVRLESTEEPTARP
jgi:hypothetical protein